MSGETCLQCGQSREQVRSQRTICGIEGGYEYTELIAEWPRHRWADWRDSDLARFNIKESAYAEYRRCLVADFQWANCEDTLQGHAFAKADWPDMGVKKGQCIDCGKKGEA